MKNNAILPIILLLLTISSFLPGTEEPSVFKVSELSGALILQYQSTDEYFEVDREVVNDITRDYFEYGLQLDVSGSIYHPGLLTFNIDFKIMSFRSKVLYFSDASTNNDVNDTYNINLSFLNNRKLNFRVYAIKDYISAERRFQDRFYNKTEKFGINVANTSTFLPFTMKLFKLNRISESLSFRERDEKSDNFELDMKLVNTQKLTTNYRLRWRDYHEEVFDSRYESLDMIADLIYFYGKENNNLISSVLSYRKMITDFSLQTLQLNTNAKHYIRKDLFAYALFSLQRNSYSLSDNMTNELKLSLNHKLFDSLESEISGGFNLQRSEYQDYDQFYTGFRFNYRKSVPTGFLNVNYIFRVTEGKYYSQNGIVEKSRVVDFGLSDSAILYVYGIKIDSIRITDKSLSHLYVAGVDYEIDTDGISIIITRIPGSNIPDGGSVRIFFEYLAYPNYNSDLRFSNLSVSVNLLKYFRLFYRNEVNNQDISSEFLIRPFEEYQRESYGLNFNSGLINSSYYKEEYYSTISGYETTHFNISIRVKPVKPMMLSLSYYSNDIDHTSGELFGKFRALTGEVNLMLLQNLKARVLYRKFDYETKDTERFRESLIFRLGWTIRKLQFDLFYERILNSYNLNRDNHDYLSLSVRRLF